MTLSIEERDAIASFRLQRAHETIVEAKGNIEMQYWHAAANRLYYACYYAVLGLLIKNGYSSRTHSGTIGLFGIHFVKTGIVSREQNKFFRKLFDLRQGGDYDDWFYLDETDIKPLLEPAEKFIKEIEYLINGYYLNRSL